MCRAVLEGPPAVRVEAFAGTGKTTTLLLVARSWLRRSPSSRVLYVTFRRRLKEEAAERFRDLGRAVRVLTNHGLAYEAVGRLYKDKLTGGSIYLNRPALVERLREEQPKALKALRAMGFGEDDVAVLLLEAVDRFTQSDDGDVGPAHFSEYLVLPEADRRAFDDVAVPLARWVWGLMRDLEGGLRITHDGYLKVYQLARPDLSDRYDLIMFDEAQDANPAMLDVLLRQEGVRRVFVGDRHQQIYAWRGAVNAMERLADWPAFPLTRSWQTWPPASCRPLRGRPGSSRGIRRGPPGSGRFGRPGRS